jgi:Cu(I)/Ag(I) efflux system membrane fusion protein/cobalt-zinc-cadmium efflux system membrane fusion protein
MNRRYRATTTAFALVIPLWLAGCNGGEDASTASSQGGRVIPAGESTDGLTVVFSSNPDPPQAGDNTFEVIVRRPDGTPLTDATVTTVFSMPAMPLMNMPAMRSEATLQHDTEGRYRGTGQLQMGGTWNVAVRVARGSEALGTRRLSIVAKQ